MKHTLTSFLLALALVGVAFLAIPSLSLYAAGTIQYYPVQIARDASFSGSTLTAGTPFAVYGQITGAPANSTCNGPKLRLMSASSGGSADSSFRTWAGTSGWLTDSGAWASFPTIATDSSGNWSGWAVGAVPVTATNTWLELRINCGGSNFSSSRVSVTLMNMSTEGGWLEETVGSTRAGRAVAVKSGTAIVGLYFAENNNISENYTYSEGGYRIAVPACTSCDYTVETWALTSPGTSVGQVNIMGSGNCPNEVAVGTVTSLNSCATPTSVTLGGLKALPLTGTLYFGLPLLGLLALGGAALYRRRRNRAL